MKLSQVLLCAALTVLMVSCSSPGDGKEAKAGGNASKAGPLRTETAAGLSFEVPASWKASAPSSSMRAAQYAIPPVKEGDDSPELALFFFGINQGGETQANIDRWIGQMTQPDGKPSNSKAKEETRKVGDFKVTTVRVNGTYASGSMMPGMGAGGDKTNYRMWGAVVEGTGGPWFFKATGPQKAMEQADPGFNALIASLKSAPAAADTTKD